MLPDAAAHGDVKMLKVLRGLRLVRLLRLLKLLKIDEIIATLETTLKVNLKVLKVGKMVGLLLFLMHLLGCFWYMLHAEGGYEVTWLSEYDGGSGLEKPPHLQYLYSVYWALTTLTTVGYGDITPVNDLERIYTLGALLVGALVFGYLLSAVGSLIANLDNRANMVEGKLEMMQEVILHSDMPAELAQRIRSYTEFYYSRQSVYDVADAFAHLTPALERDVNKFFLSQSVEGIPLLRVHSSRPFKVDVLAKLKPAFAEAKEDALTKGAPSSDLYFLRKGSVHATSDYLGSLRPAFVLTELGRCFGEHALFGGVCPVTYVAFTRCELFTLSTDALGASVRAHLPPEEQERLEHDLVAESCRKNRMRYLNLRVRVVEMRDEMTRTGRAGAAIVRTCAVLTLQAAQIRRLATPAGYTRFDLCAMWASGEAPTAAPAPTAVTTRAVKAARPAAAAPVAKSSGESPSVLKAIGALERTMRTALSDHERTTRVEMAMLRDQNAALDKKVERVTEMLQAMQDKVGDALLAA